MVDWWEICEVKLIGEAACERRAVSTSDLRITRAVSTRMVSVLEFIQFASAEFETRVFVST